MERVQVTAQRHGGETQTTLSMEDTALLCGLTSWKTADEAGVAHRRLLGMVARNLLFWSTERPSQDLSGAPWTLLEGTLALRRNVWATAIMEQGGTVAPVPFMPRMGSLAGARLVGMHLGVMEMGMQVLGVGLSCCPRHALALMDLVSSLDGTQTASALSVNPDAADMLVVLAQLGLLEAHARVVTTPNGPCVTWWGHAAVLVEMDGTRVMVDPLFHPASLPGRETSALPPDPRAVGPLDAVLITHGDNDHLNPQALVHIDRRTRIIIPRVQGQPPHQVDLRALVQLLGFQHVTEVDPWERVQIGKLTVVAAPFTGEDWGLPLANRTYVIAGTRTVYCNADSAPMPEVYARIAGEFAVDLAFVGVGGCEEARIMPPGFGYGNFYAPYMDPALRNEWLALCSNPDDAADAVLQLHAQRAFGYAAGGAPYIPVAYSDRGTHQELEAALARRGQGQRAQSLEVGKPQAI